MIVMENSTPILGYRMAFEWLADLNPLQYPTHAVSWSYSILNSTSYCRVYIYVTEYPVSSVVITSFDVKLGIEREFSMPDLTLNRIIEAGCYQRS